MRQKVHISDHFPFFYHVQYKLWWKFKTCLIKIRKINETTITPFRNYYTVRISCFRNLVTRPVFRFFDIRDGGYQISEKLALERGWCFRNTTDGIRLLKKRYFFYSKNVDLKSLVWWELFINDACGQNGVTKTIVQITLKINLHK